MEPVFVENRLALLLDHFGRVPDPREPAKVRYPLREVLFLVTCASVAGCDDYDEIADWGELNLPFLRRYSEYFFGVPGEDWLRALLNRIDPQLFEACFMNWALSLRPDAADLIALDGKSLRRSGDSCAGKSPLHLVSAWASSQQLVLAQEPVDAKENECAAILAILKRLTIKAALVTIDAIAANPQIAKAVTDAKADYLLALKSNQPTLHAEVEAYFADAPRGEMEAAETIDKDHGRIETRKTSVSRNVRWLLANEDRRYPGHPRFPSLTSLVRTVTRTEHRGKITEPTRYFISWAALTADRARAGRARPLGHRELPLGARCRLSRGPLKAPARPRRSHHGPRPPLRLQHPAQRQRPTLNQNRPKGRRLEPRFPRLPPHPFPPLTWTCCHARRQRRLALASPLWQELDRFLDPPLSFAAVAQW